jgi:hypothetical protein
VGFNSAFKGLIYWVKKIDIIKKNTEALIVASQGIREEVNADKLSRWSCLEIIMQDEVTI